MNNTIETIKNQRSVRFYDTKPIADDIINELLEAGNHAPTGSDLQPWRFIVVTTDTYRGKLASTAKVAYEGFIDTMPRLKEIRKQIDEMLDDSIYYHAPLVVFVVGKQMGTHNIDCPMVCQNMMLAARSHGIGSCWLGFGMMGLNDSIKSEMGIEEGEEIFGPIAFGYPLGDFPDAPSKKPIDATYL